MIADFAILFDTEFERDSRMVLNFIVTMVATVDGDNDNDNDSDSDGGSDTLNTYTLISCIKTAVCRVLLGSCSHWSDKLNPLKLREL